MLFWKILELLWTSPEILRLKVAPQPDLVKKGDVYSFGIILHEIIERKGPFYLREAFTAKGECFNLLSFELTEYGNARVSCNAICRFV